MVEVFQHPDKKHIFLEKFTGTVDERESRFLKEFYKEKTKDLFFFEIITSIALTSIPLNTKVLYEFMDCRNQFKEKISTISFYNLGLFQYSMVQFFFTVIKTPFHFNVYKKQAACEESLNIKLSDFEFSARMIPKVPSEVSL